MRQHNAENERVKREYLIYLKAAKGLNEASLDTVTKAIHRFEVSTKFRSLRKFHIEQAVAFRRQLSESGSSETGKPLSRATVLQTLNALRAFFLWLAGQPGYRSRISYSDADYFRLSEKDTRVAKAMRERPVPTTEQIRGVLIVMPHATEIERRNRALIAFTLLTGVRDGALASLKLKHVDLAAAKVVQDAREVNTKFSKTFTTWFFPVGDDVRAIVENWVAYLRDQKLWGGDDPLFPSTEVINGAGLKFEVSGLTRRHWSNTGPIRAIFRDAFALAGLPYFNPHSFRKTLAQLGERACRTPEELKAWSQNLGHEDVMTTLRSYGEVPSTRQAEIISNLNQPSELGMDAAAALKALETIIRRTTNGGSAAAITPQITALGANSRPVVRQLSP
jgi:integrase/recombinase XerD